MRRDQIDNLAIGIIFLAVIMIGIGLFSEVFGIIDFVIYDPPYTLPDTIPVISALSSVVLSSLLALLYFRQSLILESQEELQEYEYQPIVKAHVDIIDDTPKFIIRNVGRTAATDIRARWTFAGQSKLISTSLLKPDDQYEFPVARTDRERGVDPLSGKEVLDQFEDNTLLEYEVGYSNPHNEKRNGEEGEINVLSMIRYRAGVVQTGPMLR